MKKIVEKLKAKLSGKYDAASYWSERHQEFGLDLKGVGNKGLTQEENLEQYNQAKTTFLTLLSKEGIKLKEVDVLDIGCGNGFYAGVYKELGVRSYKGLDITSVLFDQLQNKFPGFHFEVLDIGSEKIDGKYRYISMIDVTQHITDDKKFSFAMQNVFNALESGGVFVVTSWLSDNKANAFYEKSRLMSAYEEEFKGCIFSSPLDFRDKYIFTIRKV